MLCATCSSPRGWAERSSSSDFCQARSGSAACKEEVVGDGGLKHSLAACRPFWTSPGTSEKDAWTRAGDTMAVRGSCVRRFLP